MRFVVALFFVLSISLAQDLQTRSIAHVMIDVTDRVFIPVWSITDIRSQTPNTTNLFAGVGIRSKSWWLETMLQKQWNSTQGFYALDLRYKKQFSGRFAVFLEPRVILTTPGFYDYAFLEARVWKGFSVGAETENTHRLTKQSIAAGPRMSFVWGKCWGWEFSNTVSYRLSPTGKDELRLYTSVTRRAKLVRRK